MSYRLSAKDADRVIANIRAAIKNYFEENGLVYAVFGKSEGLDSSVVAALLSGIEGVRPIGVIMPCESDLEAERIARVVLDHYKIPWIRVDLTKEFHFLMGHYYSSEGVHGQLSSILKHYGDDAGLRALPHRKPRATGNIKARLRMITLYHIAQLTGGIVISTDNLSEFWMGFWTLNGDVGDLAPIQHLWKGLEEHALAEALGVPRESIEAEPTDGLDITPGGTDRDQLGLPYEDLDRVIIALLQSGFGERGKPAAEETEALAGRLGERLGYSPSQVAHVARQMAATHYKRHWPRALARSEVGLPEAGDISIGSSERRK
jgi:NAD+ synthetase